MSKAWPMRSWLYVPGDSARKVTKAATSGADVCIVDLEDGVGPDSKADARRILAGVVPELDWGYTRLFVRIDPAGDWEADLSAAVDAGAGGIVVPKASEPDLVSAMAHQIRDAGPKLDIALILTEDAVGVRDMDRTLEAVPDTSAAFFGTEDLAASLGTRTVFDDAGQLLPVFETARGLFRLATAARGVPAIDTPYLAIDDPVGLGVSATAAAFQGFAGKQVIHPSHIPIVNDAFTPDRSEVERARSLVERFEEVGGGGALRVDGQMVDPPHLKKARSILALADLYGRGE